MRTAFFTVLGLSACALLACQHSPGEGTTTPANGAASVAPPDDASAADAGAAVAPPPQTASSVTTDASSPDASSPPATSAPDMTSAPPYPPSALHDAFSQAESRLIACYLPGKKRDPKLRGKVIVKFNIQMDGSAKPVTDEKSTLPDPEVVACVIRTIKTLRFTKPVEGNVTVVYPFIFRSSGDTTLVLQDPGKP